MRNPEMWPRMMERYKCDITFAPTFAYILTAKRMRASGNKFDLSTVHCDVAAEPVTKRCMDAMLEMGVPPRNRCSSFGCAESVVWVATSYHHDGVVTHNGQIACGDVAISRRRGSHIVIADPATMRAVPDDTEGRIFLGGRCLVNGYYDKPDINAQRFDLTLAGVDGAEDATGGWYDTQDLGFIHEGHLYVCGRASDLIIIAGRNVFPQDIERAAEQAHPEAVRTHNSC